MANAGGIRIRGQGKHWHHLFKSDVQNFLKNVSWKKGAPNLVKVPHTHFFHSINSQFRPQAMTQMVSGHFHEIEWGTRDDGTPYVKKVGPPMHYKYVQKPSGQKKVKVPVTYLDAENDRQVVDNHTHEFEYVHSEELSEENVRAMQVDNSRAIPPAMPDLLQDVGTGGSET